MELIKVKLPPFVTNIEKEEPCVAAIYIDARIVWAGRCNSMAAFETDKTCQVGILIYDVCIGFPILFYQDIVITGILSPGKQYEITQVGFAFQFTEVETKQK